MKEKSVLNSFLRLQSPWQPLLSQYRFLKKSSIINYSNTNSLWIKHLPDSKSSMPNEYESMHHISSLFLPLQVCSLFKKPFNINCCHQYFSIPILQSTWQIKFSKWRIFTQSFNYHSNSYRCYWVTCSPIPFDYHCSFKRICLSSRFKFKEDNVEYFIKISHNSVVSSSSIPLSAHNQLLKCINNSKQQCLLLLLS